MDTQNYIAALVEKARQAPVGFNSRSQEDLPREVLR
jgi:hypothetical protein